MAHAAHVCSYVQEELRVIGGRRAGAQNRIVTRALLQVADACGSEPDERVVPMQRACESREEGADGVATLDVSELVHERCVTCGFGPGVAGSREEKNWS